MAKNNIAKEILEWALTIIIPVVAALLIHQYLFTFARVDGTSMLDTLHENNIMGVSRLHYRLNEPQRGEIITCNYPGEGNKLFVKRIIGLPGETIEIREGTVYIDGEPIAEDYLTRRDDQSMDPVTLEDDEIFVMGDNRPVSRDSRAVGPLTLDEIYGRVLFVAFPFNEIRSTMALPEY
ncbi:MAG: signal peptidase I [Candidatus Spyradocola sp.]|jgi:signal peptidase I